jgi:hypothetical protein
MLAAVGCTHRRFSRAVLLGCALALAATHGAAQPVGETVDQATVQASKAALRELVDSTKPDAARLGAAKSVLLVPDDQRNAVKELLADSRESDEVRAKALNLLSDRPLEINAKLAEIVATPGDGGTLLKSAAIEALSALHLHEGHAGHGDHHGANPDYQIARDAWRVALRGNPSADVRVAALGPLAMRGDEIANDVVDESVREPMRALIPPPVAIATMSSNLTPARVALLNGVARQGAPELRASAVTVLAAAPEGRLTVAAIATDPAQNVAVRQAAVHALSVYDAPLLLRSAEKLVADKTERVDVQATALRSLKSRRSTLSQDETKKLDSVIRQASPALKNLIQ